jgi:Protein of unknown function (DUF3311)
MKKFLLGLMIAVVYLLHQDFWNWTNGSLAFGFLPAGLAYHAGYSLLASAMMAILVQCAWPAHLEKTKPEKDEQKPDKK